MNTIREFQLNNGIKCLTRRNSATPTVSFAFRIAAGDIDDPSGAEGLWDVAASVFTKGTARLTAAELAEKIDSLGLEIGFRGGRHTSMLSGRVISENLPAALKLCRQMLESAEPPAEEITRMQQRLHTALTMQLDDPATMASDRLQTMIYGADHPYGLSIEDRMQGIASISAEDVVKALRRNVTSGATRAVFVGDFDESAIDGMLSSTLESWNTGGEFAITPFAAVDYPREPSRQDIVMAGKTQSDIALGWQGITRTDDDYYALLVGNTALGRIGLGGRIGQRIREDEGLAYYAYSNFSAGIGAGPFSFRAGVNPNDVNKAIDIALEEMRRAAAEGLSQEEIDDAVRFLSGSLARQMEKNGGLAAVLLNQDLYDLGSDYYQRFPDILSGLSRDEVNAALSKHLRVDQYACSVAGPAVE